MKLGLRFKEILTGFSVFFDSENIIVIGNAYQKKNNKLSKKEINKALSIMKEYQHEK